MARSWIEQQVERLVARPSDQTQRGGQNIHTCCEVLRDGSRAGTSTARYYDVIVLSEGWDRVDFKAFSADAFANGEDRPVHPILRNVSCPASVVLDAGASVVIVGASGLVGSPGDGEFEALPDKDFDVVPVGDGRGVLLAGAGSGLGDWGVVVD